MMARHRSPAVRLLLLPNKQMHLNAPSWAVCVSDAVLLSQSGSVRIGVRVCWSLGQFVWVRGILSFIGTHVKRKFVNPIGGSNWRNAPSEKV